MVPSSAKNAPILYLSFNLAGNRVFTPKDCFISTFTQLFFQNLAYLNKLLLNGVKPCRIYPVLWLLNPVISRSELYIVSIRDHVNNLINLQDTEFHFLYHPLKLLRNKLMHVFQLRNSIYVNPWSNLFEFVFNRGKLRYKIQLFPFLVKISDQLKRLAKKNLKLCLNKRYRLFIGCGMYIFHLRKKILKN